MTDTADTIRTLVEQGKQEIEAFTQESQESFYSLSSSARDEFIQGLDNFLSTDLNNFQRQIARLTPANALSNVFGNSPFGQGAGTFLSSLFSGFLRMQNFSLPGTAPTDDDSASLNFSQGQASAQAMTQLSRGQRNL